MSNIVDLHRKRGGIKAKLSNTKKFLEGLNLEQFDKNAKEILLNELKIRAINQENLLKDFNEIQSVVECKCEEQELESEYEYRCNFENEYYKVTAILNSLVDQFADTNASVKNNSNSSDTCSETDQAATDETGNQVIDISNNIGLANAALKLPTINLPTFSGSFTNWLEFKDMFVSLIHDNNSIAKIQKFHYLRASLEEPAAQVIKSIEFCAQNYDTAWELLCNRFDNNHLLVHNHIKAIFDLPIISRDSSSAYRRMVDEISKHLRSLDILQTKEETFDTIIIYILLNKLDIKTTKDWEEKKQGGSMFLDEFKDFLKNKADLLETLEARMSKATDRVENSQRAHRFKSFTAKIMTCNVCKQNHSIYHCKDFLNMSVEERVEQVKRLKLCFNCLQTGHGNQKCSAGNCRKCKAKHNTLLHREKTETAVTNETTTFNACCQLKGQVILATVKVIILDKYHKPHSCRAMLDCGSQSHFMTSRLCKKLGLQKKDTNIYIVGINQVSSKIKYECNASIRSSCNRFQANISVFIIDTISGGSNSWRVDRSSLEIPANIALADPEFGESQVDLLLGGDLFWKILQDGRIHLGNDKPVLQNTVFGWVIAGGMQIPSPTRTLECHFSKTVDIEKQLRQFWEIEEYPNPILSAEDTKCEEIFRSTTTRNSEGRFMVTIPFKQDPTSLGDSREQALKRLLRLENKLEKQTQFRNMYIQFMLEYEELGHMTKSDMQEENGYFLPHHGIMKEESLTSKLRVVFDGSAATSNGTSLNDLQYTGQNLQQELVTILIRFREHKFVFTADISKMYRQIEVRKEDRKYQKILWRADKNQEVQEYELNTVTYGTRSAPYLAIRCIKQLAIENEVTHPVASQIIGRDFYVDDLMSGTQDVEAAAKLAQEISTILETACFTLRKWSSNNIEVLKLIDEEKHTTRLQEFKDDKCKTLGLQWSCKSDTLSYKIKDSYHSDITKRSILSEASQIFDPLGLLSPCVIKIKLMLQQFWSLKLSWDEAIPFNLQQQWLHWRKDLMILNGLQIKRHVLCGTFKQVQLHGFCDSSQKAYGACIYARSISSDDSIHVNLVCAKSKVAPLKALTIPRLELCGALVLARLMDKVKEAFTIKVDCYYWTDSQIVLAWLKSESTMLQVFVSNRVAEIQMLTEIDSWNYVNTLENPADYLSRGLQPSQIMGNTRWWHGPGYLHKQQIYWPNEQCEVDISRLPEIKQEIKVLIAQQAPDPYGLLRRYSSFKKLLRVTALCYRFVNNCRQRERITGTISPKEMSVAQTGLIRMSQREDFLEDYQILSNLRSTYKGRLLNLHPFIDQDGIIRVGGRLQNSGLAYEQKHPALISSKSLLSELIFRDLHEELLHAGPQLMLYTSREKYWIIGGRNLARKIARTCITCFRVKPSNSIPLMGNLPSYRVTPALPFSVSGTDFAGPFLVRERLGRGVRTYKCYICIFVCMTTKAVHIEPVTDLTTDSFMSVLKRFIARRGVPSHLLSDNGRTYVKASKEISVVGNFLLNHSEQLSSKSAQLGIKWSFIPPNSPNFGGIWESAVKSTKYHLKRILLNRCLTFEHFLTLLVTIEGILNSRPICPISNDPNDYQALTPGHFLIGRPIMSLPEENLLNVNLNRLTVHKQLQHLKQQFWKRWSHEYLTQLQQRTKWMKNQEDMLEGSLVLLKDDNLPSTQWRTGRIIGRHSGQDGVTRVVSVKTADGIFRRAVSKVCPLPLESGPESEQVGLSEIQ